MEGIKEVKTYHSTLAINPKSGALVSTSELSNLQHKDVLLGFQLRAGWSLGELSASGWLQKKWDVKVLFPADALAGQSREK